MKYEKKDYKAMLMGSTFPRQEFTEEEEEQMDEIVSSGIYEEGGKCKHSWDLHKEQQIQTGNKLNQTIQWLICKNCGEILNINITTGDIIKRIRP